MRGEIWTSQIIDGDDARKESPEFGRILLCLLPWPFIAFLCGRQSIGRLLRARFGHFGAKDKTAGMAILRKWKGPVEEESKSCCFEKMG